MLTGTCIGFLEDAGCGLIYADDFNFGPRIVFVHFRDIYPEGGWQGLRPGERVKYTLDAEKGAQFHRTFAASGLGRDGFIESIETDKQFLRFCEVGCLDKEELFSADSTQIVFTGEIPESWSPPKSEGHLLFYGCHWRGKASFSKLTCAGDLVFLGCVFSDAFTLKEANVYGNVHMEGSNFSGRGGASFRGLQAQNLYLDFGVKGPRDMVWLNEMHINGNVVVGGAFEGAIQIMRIQDDRVKSKTAINNQKKDRPCIHEMFIGKEFYSSQNINRTILRSALDIHGLSHRERIHIEQAEIGEISASEIGGGTILACSNSKVLGSVSLSGKYDEWGEASAVGGVGFENTFVEGHLVVRDMKIDANSNGLTHANELNLDDATVGRVIRLHNVSFGKGAGLKIARLSASRLVMNNFASLYGESKPNLWQNPRFLMLKREAERGSIGGIRPNELVQEYVLLKNLLSQEGQLRLEDEAYYNMRKLSHWKNDAAMFLFNYVFGWGVRLKNILFSVLILVVLYATTYETLFPVLGVMNAFELSIQSMFMAFFGEMSPKVTTGSSLSWLVLSESIIGVVFVTVFVGAYVRKLLR